MLRSWLQLLTEIAVGALICAVDMVRPQAVRAPKPPPPMTPLHDTWVSDGDGPLMHVGALTYSEAMRSTTLGDAGKRAA
jgi:hypothetical protein